MNHTRQGMLALMVVLGVFVCALVASLFAIHQQEVGGGVLTTLELTALKDKLKDNVKDEELKKHIRLFDATLRQDHFRNRRRFTWAGYFLVAALIAWLAAARRFVALKPQPAPEELLPTPVVRRPLLGGALTGGLTSALFVVLIYGGLASCDATTYQKSKAGAGAAPVQWPCLRGPGNLGLAGKGDWPTTWSVEQNLNIVWRVEAPIFSKSSPVIWGDFIFISGSDYNPHAKEEEAAPATGGPGGAAGEEEKAPEQLSVACLDRATGEVLWNTFAPAPPPLPEDSDFEVFEDTGMAAATPATDGRRVYAMYGDGTLMAVDFDGRRVWSKHLGWPESAYGFATSLIVHDGLLILQYDQSMDVEDKKSALIAFDSATGERRWSWPRPVPNSWASPSLIQTKERTELITCGDPWVISYNPKDGVEYWRAKLLSGDVAPSPAWNGKQLFVTNDNALLAAITPGGQGDVTETHVLWTVEDGMPDTASPICDDNYILQAGAGGLLTCFKVTSNTLIWEKYLESSASSSPILAGGNVYVSMEDGVTLVLKLSDKFQPFARGEIGEPIFATPAFVDSRVYIRGTRHIICVGKKSEPSDGNSGKPPEPGK